MKIDPKYAFLHAFFLMSIPKFVNMTKNIPFFPILHVFAPLNDVRAYIAWSWKTTLITREFFYADYIQLQIQVAPPPGSHSNMSHRSSQDQLTRAGLLLVESEKLDMHNRHSLPPSAFIS